MIAEYALARLGRSRTPISVIAEWEQFPRAAVERREWAYWIALTLLQRGEAAKAESMALAALSAPAVRGNPEQGWRLAAVAALAAKKNPASTLAKTVAGLKNTTPAELEAAWGPAAKTYFARPDLVALRNSIR
jgi:hypothetical protein